MRVGWWKTGCAAVVMCLATAIAASGQTFETLVVFSGVDGSFPVFDGSLVQGSDGSLYGTTMSGGGHEGGTVFAFALASGLNTLYRFCAQTECADGAGPEAGLVLATDGNFYGTTRAGGGREDAGTVFRITPGGALTTIYSFTDNTGFPYAGLIQAADGNLYGTAGDTVFRTTLGGSEGIVSIQSGSYGSLVQATDGDFYGTTNGGGASNDGTVFKVTPTTHVTTLYSFCYQTNCTDGFSPDAPLIQAADGNFYGTTLEGGSADCGNGCGTVFKMTPGGTLTTLHSFDRDDGAGPYGGVIQAIDGNFYGLTIGGGEFGDGTIFQVTPEGVVTTLHSFDGTDGTYAYGRLLQDTSGIFYGATAQGGKYNSGTLFSLDMGLGPFVAFVNNPAKVGQTFGVLGQGFTGTTSVSLNGVQATFTVVSDTFIRATVPPGATTGYVTVMTPSGTLTSNVPFRVLQ
jgi:uncharacterized repeat protein (TIGR03803 family)